MATAINSASFESLKEDIIRVFEQLHQKLDERKQVLMGQLLAIKEEVERSTDLDKEIRQLKEKKEIMLAKLVENVIGKEKEEIEMFDDKIKKAEALKLAEKSCLVKLRCYTEKLEEGIAQISLVEDIPAYASKLTPVIKCGDMGSGHGEFSSPCGICIDATTNNVFVADCGNKRIQVLNYTGEYVNAFGKRNLMEPWGVAVTDQFVYVTDLVQHCIMQFRRDGKFIKSVGFRGAHAPLVFNCPRGIAASNDKLYVCDAGNHRVQVVNTSLKYIDEFWSDKLFLPTDIHATVSIIHVLPQVGNVVHLFANRGYIPLQVIKLTGQEYDMKNHFCLTVDQSGNYLIGAHSEKLICVFDNTGLLRHVIGEGHMEYPKGIAVDGDNNIICISGSVNYIFQMY